MTKVPVVLEQTDTYLWYRIEWDHGVQAHVAHMGRFLAIDGSDHILSGFLSKFCCTRLERL